jgi:hypothetical protein
VKTVPAKKTRITIVKTASKESSIDPVSLIVKTKNRVRLTPYHDCEDGASKEDPYHD